MRPQSTARPPRGALYAQTNVASAATPHPRPDGGAARGAAALARAGHPPPLARLRRVFAVAQERLRAVFRTENEVLVFTASGTGAFESAVVNLLSPGERVLAVSQGEFGERWQKLARAFGCDVVPLTYAWGEAPSPEDVRAALAESGAELGVPRALRDVDRRRLRPRAARSPPAARPARSRSSTRSRASARSRWRPTPGAPTSSSPARRRR